ncbi:SMC-Scp complex subunit ScpB [Adhaeretor mobilis]|uniref:Segregation and condensation protein B n=1 Tax=Adhaeretor mobilis TaxID=1930276 RepID=A0A517N3B4_9BACT|nr:SMC-Scp complex subunit ScpB [Adhaeretor mobilis]QDT01631.1 Segregation and condensation protein B [Adhaeretor mobilis]
MRQHLPTNSLGLPEKLGSVALRYHWPGESGGRMQRGGHDSATLELTPPVVEPSPEQQQADEQQRLEAVLFLAREPLSTRKLAKLAGLVDGTLARTLIKRLNQRLRGRGSALEIVEIAGGWQLLTRTELADWIARLHGGGEDLRLSAPALETLAVAAYRQPVLRVEIEAIRGVQCGEMLRVLMERGFLRIVGRSEELGRPFLYGTTRKFLQVFGLRRLEQLPPMDQTQYTTDSPAIGMRDEVSVAPLRRAA